MGKRPYRPPVIDANPGRPISKRQFKYIKVLCRENLLRAESVIRAVTSKEITHISYAEAHQVIQHLERESLKSDWSTDSTAEKDLSCRLDETNRRSQSFLPEDYVLALLAFCRVATPGQCARFAYGVNEQTYDSIRHRIEPVLDLLQQRGWVGCARGVTIEISGVDTMTDVFHLTETGSDRLHNILPHLNYFAKPGLPERRIYHDLAVTEALLDRQTHRDIIWYGTESYLLGEQERERRKAKKDGYGNHNEGAVDVRGSGDFCGHELDPRTGKWRYIEIEVSNLQRGEKLRRKPLRVSHHYVSTLHLLDVVESEFGTIGKLIPDVRRPLKPGEELVRPQRPRFRREALNVERISEVERAFFEVLGAAATPHAVGCVLGLGSNDAGEALNHLVDAGRIFCRDGRFPLSKKLKGRPLRLFYGDGIETGSPYEFVRLMTASELVVSRRLDQLLERSLRIISHNPSTGIIVFDDDESPCRDLIFAIVDDESETPERVAEWALAAHRQVVSGDLHCTIKVSSGVTEPDNIFAQPEFYVGIDRIVIVTSDGERARRLERLAAYEIINVAE